MLEPDVTTALAQLQKRTGSDKMSLFEHLTSLVAEVLETRGEEVDVLHLSELVKKQALTAPRSDGIPQALSTEDVQEIRRILQLYGDRQPPIDPRTGMPVKVDEPNTFASEDLVQAANMLEAVGAGMDSQEMYRVMLQLKRLGEDPELKLKSVRFFGKMLGTFADYYIFEAEPAAQEPESDTERAQREADRRYPPEHGTGANAHAYFATTTLGAQRPTRLPNARPEHIAAARRLKRFLTGDPTAPVSTYPPFPWTEAEFLRAQIARIAAATVLAPAGWYSAEENDEGKTEVVAAEEQEPLAPPEGDADEWLANWVHRTPHLKRQGRCDTKPIRELPEDSEEEVTLEADETEESPEAGQVLAPISEDAKLAGGGAAWTALVSSTSKFTKGQVVGVRSVVWPGAAAVTCGGAATNIYVGWGIKNAAYVPPPPPPVATEFDLGQLASVDLPVKANPDAEPAAENGGEGEDE